MAIPSHTDEGWWARNKFVCELDSTVELPKLYFLIAGQIAHVAQLFCY